MTENAQSISQDTTLYAQWEQNTEGNEVTVTLDYQGGYQGDNPSSITPKVGSTYGNLPEPTKDGGIFIGWYTEINGRGTKIESNTTVTNSSAHTLYAYYGQAIRITFDYDGATGGNELEYKDIVYQGKLGELPQPTKEGYTFDGWYSTKEFTNKLSPDSRIPSPTTIYAKWIKNEDENIAVTGIELTPTTSEIKVGGIAAITATVKPDNATNKNVTWSSSNTAVATVSESGVITGKSEGTATITATTVDGNYTAEATITVKKDIEDTEGPKITVEQTKDSEGRYIVLIKVTNESGIKEVKVNNTVLKADEDGNYSFISNENGKYNIKVTDTEGNTSTYSYEETRFSENGGNNSGNNNNGGNNGNSGNSGNKDNSGSNGNFNNNGNSGNGTIENKNNLNNNGSNNTTGKTGDTITTSTALTELPKTGSTMGVLFAAIASGISAIIAWFKHRKMKQ